ncbi:hypothetical protein BGZ95_004591 [Linnemannia exigua]|uniref:Rhomboid-type serine protease n=1 Tax=Linnemannia exigua TaxID=604196 RepID=A0AAD4H306_9FUNG|nr:hypothetical protein BGZ95_004591 [Linnemannia exigua]
MSYNNSSKPEWGDHDHDKIYDGNQPSGTSPSSSHFNNDHQQSSYSPTTGSYLHQDKSGDYLPPSPHRQGSASHGQGDEDGQYPMGRPLSYFPTHHQPLSQQEYDDEQQRTSNYHQLPPLQNAPSPLSSRQEWTYQGGYHPGGAPANDIPLVGIDIVSSNLEATRQGTQYSDTRTAENMSPHRGADPNSVYTAAGGVGDSQQYGQQDHALPPLPSHTNNNHDDGQTGSQYSGGEPIPKVLLDPKVQRQLNNRKVWRPWFVWTISAVQIGVLIFEIYKGYQRTNRIIETQPFNPMIGPGTGTIIAIGARFVPCMRSTYLDNQNLQCPDNTTAICTISDICGFTPISSTGKAPDQWFRFITPVFLHGGVLHLLFNLLFQMRTGADLERDMGWWRFAIIYMTSGIAGFIFGGNFAPLLSPSMGASGALFGLIGCLVLDLIQNWKLVVRPCWELSKLSIMILVSFAFGLLPFLDNFAHIGGFIAGILTGLVFMPVVYFSKRDKYIKLGLRVIALPLIVMLIVLGLTNFYKGVNNCSWCKYLSCLPINGWCDAFNPPEAPANGAGN